MDSSSKKIIVVGCAGGIGYQTTSLLLNEGYTVIGTVHKNTNKIDALKKHKNFTEKTLDLTIPHR